MDESAAGDALASLASLTGDVLEMLMVLEVLLCRLVGVGLFSLSSLPLKSVCTDADEGGELLRGEDPTSTARFCIRARLACTTRTPPPPPPPLAPPTRLEKNGVGELAGGEVNELPLFADIVSAVRLWLGARFISLTSTAALGDEGKGPPRRGLLLLATAFEGELLAAPPPKKSSLRRSVRAMSGGGDALRLLDVSDA